MRKIITLLSLTISFALLVCSNPASASDPISEDYEPALSITINMTGADDHDEVILNVEKADEGDTITLKAMPDSDVVIQAEFSNFPMGSYYKETNTAGSIKFNLLPVPGGATFIQGEHSKSMTQTTTLTRNIWIGETEVTQELWLEIMGSWPSADVPAGYFVGDKKPVIEICIRDCAAFCIELTKRIFGSDENCVYTNTDGKIYSMADPEDSIPVMDMDKTGFRLPTRAEWEYSSRYIDGTRFLYSNHISGDESGYGPFLGTDDERYGEERFTNAGTYAELSVRDRTVDVKSHSPNLLGLYDMSMNVWERVWSDTSKNSGNIVTDPVTDPGTGSYGCLLMGASNSQGTGFQGSFMTADPANTMPYDARHKWFGMRFCRTTE